MIPEALNAVAPEQKHQIYKTLRMKVLVGTEGTVAVKLVSGHAPDSGAGSVKTKNLCS